MLGRRGRTGDLIYAFLMQHGPADMQDIIAQVQRTTNAKRRTIQDAVNHDPANRFLKLDERRVAANPIPQDHNPAAGHLVVIPDDGVRRPAPVLRESELAWLTHYVRALNTLERRLPLRVAMSQPTGRRWRRERAAPVTSSHVWRQGRRVRPRRPHCHHGGDRLSPQDQSGTQTERNCQHGVHTGSGYTNRHPDRFTSRVETPTGGSQRPPPLQCLAPTSLASTMRFLGRVTRSGPYTTESVGPPTRRYTCTTASSPTA